MKILFYLLIISIINACACLDYVGDKPSGSYDICDSSLDFSDATLDSLTRTTLLKVSKQVVDSLGFSKTYGNSAHVKEYLKKNRKEYAVYVNTGKDYVVYSFYKLGECLHVFRFYVFRSNNEIIEVYANYQPEYYYYEFIYDALPKKRLNK
jgi:hypothetical protein